MFSRFRNESRQPVVLYHFAISPPSRAVLMLLKQLNMPHQVKQLDLLKGEHKTDEFKKINPTQTVPTIVDGDVVMWESRAIMRYLVAINGNNSLYPRDLQRRAVVDRLLDFDLGTLFSNIMKCVGPQLFHGEPEPATAREELNKSLDSLENVLADEAGPFLTGNEMTIADLSVFSGLQMLRVFGKHDELGEKWPRIERASAKLRQLPFYEEIHAPLNELAKSKTPGAQ